MSLKSSNSPVSSGPLVTQSKKLHNGNSPESPDPAERRSTNMGQANPDLDTIANYLRDNHKLLEQIHAKSIQINDSAQFTEAFLTVGLREKLLDALQHESKMIKDQDESFAIHRDRTINWRIVSMCLLVLLIWEVQAQGPSQVIDYGAGMATSLYTLTPGAALSRP